MNFDPNALYFKMAAYISQHKNDEDKIIILNEGGSRSSKTWDVIHLLLTYCDHNRKAGKELYVFRDTLTNCKDYTLKEFINCFREIGINIPVKNPQKPEMNIYGNTIYFRGLVDESLSEAAPSDVIFVNEILDINSQTMISGWLMRCREMFIGDCNPKFANHWAFDLEYRPNALFTHTTYKDNKHLSQSIINEIEMLNPNIEANVVNKTADDYRWNVYGLGLRRSPEGLIYHNYTWVDDLPDEYDNEWWGLDLGFTVDPAALCQTRRHGRNLYAKKRLYLPCKSAEVMAPFLEQILPSMDTHFWVDSAHPLFVADLRKLGFRALLIKKSPGYKMPAIGRLQSFNLHFVKDEAVKRELQNYRRRVIQGMTLDEPVDTDDHFLDAFLYSTLHEIRVKKE